MEEMVSRMENYAEIFGGFANSCSIPVLVLPEAMEGLDEGLVGSQSYLEIFGLLDAGVFSLSYEELLSMEKGSSEKDEKDDSFRFLEETDVGQVETTRPPELPAEEPVGGHTTFSKQNQMPSSFHSNFVAGKNSQLGTVDEVKNTLSVSWPQANCGPGFEPETVPPIGLVEDDSTSNVACDDYVLSEHMIEEKDAGKQREILNRCFVDATLDDSENDLNDFHKSPSNGYSHDLKPHSRSSSYHSTSSGDIPISDYSFLTISDINLRTQPLEVPPPLRAPPTLDMKQGISKSEPLVAPNVTSNRNYQAHHGGGPRKRHVLKGAVKNTAASYSNVEVDASKAAAAMIEAMEQAQNSLNSAKELMERNWDSPRSDEILGPQDFGFWHEQNIIFSGDSKHKKKKAPKVLPSHVEKATLVLSGDAEEAIRGKECGSSRLSGENERPHKWKKDKQFYELVSSEKLIRNRVINSEKNKSNEDARLDPIIDANKYFLEKESYGLQGQRFLHGGDDNEDENKVETLDAFKINEKKIFSEGEFQMQERNATTLKFGSLVDQEKVMNVFETSVMSCLQGNDEEKQKINRAPTVPSEDIKKLVDTVVQHDRNKNDLKQCQDSSVCAEVKNNTVGDTEPNAFEMNDSGMMGSCMGGKLEDFDGGEVLEETVTQVKETHPHTSDKEEISGTSVFSEYDAFKSDECMAHSMKEDNCNVTSEFSINKECKETKLSSLQNGNEVEVDAEEKNMEAREECNIGMLKQIKRENYAAYNDVKYSEVDNIHNKSEQENRNFSGIDQTTEPVKKQRAKWNIPNKSELNVAKLFVQPICFEKAKEVLEFQQNEEKNVFELPQKFEDNERRLIADGEERKDEKNVRGKVQAALELEKKIMGLRATQQVFQRTRVQDKKSVQRANSLDDKRNIPSPSVDSSGSSWKQMEKSKSYQWRDASSTDKEILDRQRNKEAEQKRKLEKERAREREKDMISVEKVTHVGCEGVFIEARERPENTVLESVATEVRRQPLMPYRDIMEKSYAEQVERPEKVVNEAKLREVLGVVERATAEARERAIERPLTEGASIGDRKQVETSENDSKDNCWKCNEAGLVRPDDKESDNNLKRTSDVHDAPIAMKSQSEICEGESPLRCRARQERCKRVVERAAKALADKNMRDLLAQREQAERNRLAESLDAEIRRWSSGKEGNLRALLSTLQYILGHDSGWHPIPLTEVITAAAVRKAYRKATLCVHPDKLQQRGATIQHKYICEKVFDLLKDAWSKFNAEGRY